MRARATAGSLALVAHLLVAHVLVAHVLVAQGAAQRDATALQLRVIEAYVDREVARPRGGAPLEAAQAVLVVARAELAAAIAARQPIDLDRVRAQVAADRAAIEANLAEVGRTCGPIPDTTPARARRDALITIEASLARGPFVPPL